MRVDTHAAVNETVGLARMVNGAGASGFVNAVLRRVSERSPEEWIERVAPAADAADTDAVLSVQGVPREQWSGTVGLRFQAGPAVMAQLQYVHVSGSDQYRSQALRVGVSVAF